ncbi:MAG: hypothetical protein LBD67_06385 [Candidatus Accumulibacter sp.]|jgi:hypothetical protein|nr:hypothetical protein [Accumulibacter sp.]
MQYGDDRGGVHQDEGDIVDAPKPVAEALTRLNRALFLDRKDDADPGKRHTAPAALIQAAEKAAKGKTAVGKTASLPLNAGEGG